MKAHRDNMQCCAAVCLGAALLAVAISPASAQSFTGIGVLPGRTSSWASAVSGDGTTVVGWSSGSGSQRAIRWTQEGGMEDLGLVPGGQFARAWGVNADGTVVVGSCYPFAFRWTREGGMQSLGRPPGWSLVAQDVNDDGTVVVGYASFLRMDETTEVVPIRWTSANGLSVLPTLPGTCHSEASGVSGDGSVIVGHVQTGDERANLLRWTDDGGIEDLGTLEGSGFTRAYGVSNDGSTIVGESFFGTDPHAIRWTRAGGIEDINSDAGWSVARAASGDGAIIVGDFLWHPILGRFRLDVYLWYHGIVPDGWSLDEASGISDDGLTIVGVGRNKAGELEGWVATIPGCRADFNGDYLVDSQDFFDFLTAFFATDAAADFNADGTVDSADFFEFLDAFFAPCL